jgi:hypothetical protein
MKLLVIFKFTNSAARRWIDGKVTEYLVTQSDGATYDILILD